MKKIISDSDSSTRNKFAQFEKTQQATIDVPSGYLPIKLSTKGLLGAPEVFHVRNFDTKHIVDLALSEDEQLPEKVANLLDSLIFEDISVRDFHEKEVIELLVAMFQTFFSNELKDIDFQYTEEDEEEFYKSTLFDEETKKALRTGKWKPKTTVYLDKLEIYDIDTSTFRNKIKINNPKTNFSVSFSFPRFGDVLVVKEFINEVFQKEEKRWNGVKGILKFRQESEKKIEKGDENINFASLPNVTQKDKDDYRKFELEKALFSIDAIRALHIREFGGEDVSNLSLSERMNIVQDPRFDITITNKVEKFFTKDMKIGIKEEISMYNPLTKKNELRRFSFRIVDILQAVQLFESDDYDVEFELENS